MFFKPIQQRCADCKEFFEKRSPAQVRCPSCQYELKKRRARELIQQKYSAVRYCLNCGAVLGKRRTKYCNTECKQNYYKKVKNPEKEQRQKKLKQNPIVVTEEYGHGQFPDIPKYLKDKLYEEYWVQGADGLLELIEIGKDVKFRKTKRMVHE